MTTAQNYSVFTDGACSGNPGPGGWAFLVIADGWENDPGGRHSTSGAVNETTNQRMELQAVVEAMGWLANNGAHPFTVKLHTDSKYVKDGMVSWINRWQTNGWKTRTGEAVKNADLWQRILELTVTVKVEWVWVEGHADNKDHNYVDDLAVKAIQRFRRKIKARVAEAGKRYLVLTKIKGTKRTQALLDSDSRVRVFETREVADREASKRDGEVMEMSTTPTEVGGLKE